MRACIAFPFIWPRPCFVLSPRERRSSRVLLVSLSLSPSPSFPLSPCSRTDLYGVQHAIGDSPWKMDRENDATRWKAPLARRAITSFKMIGRATAAAIFRAHSVKSMTHYWDVFTSCFVSMLDRLMSRLMSIMFPVRWRDKKFLERNRDREIWISFSLFFSNHRVIKIWKILNEVIW